MQLMFDRGGRDLATSSVPSCSSSFDVIFRCDDRKGTQSVDVTLLQKTGVVQIFRIGKSISLSCCRALCAVSRNAKRLWDIAFALIAGICRQRVSPWPA